MEEEAEVDPEDSGGCILRDEFNSVVKQLKGRKASGIDDLLAQLIKNAGYTGLNEFFNLVSKPYETDQLPSDFWKNIIVPLPKKASATKCDHYRTLSLLTHALKILSTVILRRIEGKIKAIVTENQFGFRNGRGAREAIMSSRLIIGKRLRKDQDTHITLIDQEKEFDSVN